MTCFFNTRRIIPLNYRNLLAVSPRISAAECRSRSRPRFPQTSRCFRRWAAAAAAAAPPSAGRRRREASSFTGSTTRSCTSARKRNASCTTCTTCIIGRPRPTTGASRTAADRRRATAPTRKVALRLVLRGFSATEKSLPCSSSTAGKRRRRLCIDVKLKLNPCTNLGVFVQVNPTGVLFT